MRGKRKITLDLVEGYLWVVDDHQITEVYVTADTYIRAKERDGKGSEGMTHVDGRLTIRGRKMRIDLIPPHDGITVFWTAVAKRLKKEYEARGNKV